MGKITVAIIGVGARGGDVYGNIINGMKDDFKIVALCDERKERLDRFGRIFEVESENLFSDENAFFSRKRADLLVIATQDADHVRHCVKAFECGYDVLLEKPITDKAEECYRLLEAQKKSGCKALVCHVLRYAPAFLKVAEMIEKKEIGELVCIDALERVAYWHQAHSYVRGNWRSSKRATPMILAKCCHDLDLLQFYAKSKCLSISSVGNLRFFTAENKPEGSAERCISCQYTDTCPYSAKNIYINEWEDKFNSPCDVWPYNVVAAAPLTRDKLEKAVAEGPYGRCVFACDNDVVDHQITQMTFENGVKATLTMTAFTAGSGRRMDFHGTLGEIVLDEEAEIIRLHKYGKDPEDFKLKDLKENGYGHGGGDFCLISELADILKGRSEQSTSLEASVESHLMGICAEESREQGGKLIYIKHF